MNKPDPVDASQQVDGQAPSAGPAMAPPVSSARRRLIRLGAAAVPVAATVASRPALAWHCQTVSAWGSEKANPNTSLGATNSPELADETWTCKNWAKGTDRASLGGPWNKLLTNYPSLCISSCEVNKNSTPNVKIGNKYYRASLLKMSQLKGAISGFEVPSGAADNDTLATTLSPYSSFKALMTTAQLNFVLLSTRNNWGLCLTPNGGGNTVPLSLRQMAVKTYNPPNSPIPWSEANITAYLQANWIAVPDVS